MAFVHENRAYIVMASIEGQMLRDFMIKEGNFDSACSITSQIHSIVKQLSQLDSQVPQPHSFSSWPGVPYNSHFFWGGPPGLLHKLLTSEEEFHAFWIDNLAPENKEAS